MGCADAALYTCIDNSTCSNIDGGYACSCDEGFEMVNGVCESIDDCSAEPCMNGGSCTDGHMSYTCSCDDAWTGATCEEDVNECAYPSLYDCIDNSTCSDVDGGYACSCDEGFEMVDGACESIDDCSPQPCMNGGSCTDGHMSHTCS